MGLLDLPVELRLEIYDHITDTECDIELIRQTLSKCAEPTHRYITAWCNMMLVCRQIANEINNYIEDNSAGDRSKYNTWTMHLSTTFTSDRLPAAMKLPCSPAQLKAVKVIIPIWCGVANRTSIPYDIDWTLNQLVCYGPLWAQENGLKSPLRYEELILSFSFREDDYYSGKPDNYHEEELVVLAFYRMQKRWTDGKNLLMTGFSKVTVMTKEYEKSWTMVSEEDRMELKGVLSWMVRVCRQRAAPPFAAHRICAP